MSRKEPPLTVNLSQPEWMAVLESLGQRPYSEVANLIEAIAEQLGPQIREAGEHAQPAQPRCN